MSNFKLKCTGCDGGTGPEAASMKLVPAAQLAAEGVRPRSGLCSMPASQWRHRKRGSDPHSGHVWSVCRYLCLLRQVPRSLLWWQARGRFTWFLGPLWGLTGCHIALLWTSKPLESAQAPSNVCRCCEQGSESALSLGVGTPVRRLRASPGLAPSHSDLAQGLSQHKP